MWPFTRKPEPAEIIADEQARTLRGWRKQMDEIAARKGLNFSMGFGPCQHEYTAETRSCAFCGRGGLAPGQSCPGCGAAE